MEDNRNHIDDLLREKMQDMHFDLNEQHWADAERRLDEDDKKKKPIWLLFFAVVVLVGAGLTALTNKNKDSFAKQSQTEQKIESSTSRSANKQNTNNDERQTSFIAEQKKSNNNQSVTNDNTKNNDEQISDDKNVAAFTPAPPRNNNRVKTTNANNRQLASDAKKAQATSATNNRKSANANKPTDNIVRNSSTTRSAKSTDNKQLTPKKLLKTKGDLNTSQGPKTDLASMNAKDISTNASTTQLPAGDNVKNSLNANSTKSARTNKDVVMLGNARVYRSPEDYQKMNPRYVAGLENYAYSETIISLGQEKSDSIRQLLANQKEPVAEVNKDVTKAKKRFRIKKVYTQESSNFYMLLGVAGARGYKGNLGESQQWGFSPSIGAGYEFTFSDKMSIYLSAYMSYLGNLNIKETGTTYTYSFDRDSTLLSVTRKNLLQLHLPIELSYKIQPKHRVYGGLGLNLGLNTVSLYEDSKANSSSRQFGYMGGLRFVDVTASLGYEYAISNRMNVGVFYQQGFFDMTQNDYFNNQHNDMNARGGVRLRYKFIK